jgi:hypothetical protein
MNTHGTIVRTCAIALGIPSVIDGIRGTDVQLSNIFWLIIALRTSQLIRNLTIMGMGYANCVIIVIPSSGNHMQSYGDSLIVYNGSKMQSAESATRDLLP